MMTRKTFYLAVPGLVLLVTGLSGCVFGPASIAAGRGVYNEVINHTEDEQLLSMIVHDRYNETSGMLSVSSVTASIRSRASVDAQFGLSRSLREDYAGNLVPLAGGLAFEENPTISYAPLGGEQHVLRLLRPLSIEETLLTAQYLPRRLEVNMVLGLRSINGILSPLVTPDGSGSPRFERVVQLWTHLRRVGALSIAREPNGEYGVVFSLVDTEHERALEELLELAGISKRPSGGRLVLTVRVSAAGRSEVGFNFQTRSVLEILRTAGASIDIPEPHLKAGVVEPEVDRLEGRFIQIRSSRIRPGGEGTIAIPYRGWWYFVDDADPASKQAFQVLRMLVDLRLRGKGQSTPAHVLSLPVG